MRKLFFLIGVLYLFTGCSTVYTVNDFGTKEKFYADCVSTASGKTVDVVLINDSSFTGYNAHFATDTLFTLPELHGRIDNKFIPASYIKTMVIDSSVLLNRITYSADIVLNSGEKFSAENVRIRSDGLTFSSLGYQKTPVNMIRRISCKTRTYTALGGLVGTAVVGWIILKSTSGETIGADGPTAYGYALSEFARIIIFSPVIGGLTGFLIGWNIIYQFP